MSLINQMLKDLDARHEADARGRLHREVRPLPATESARGGRLVVLLMLVVGLAAAAWWASSQYFVSVPRAPAPAVTTASEVAAPAVVPAVPPASLSADASEAVTAPAAPAVPDVPTVLNETSGMKMSAMLDRVPEASAADARPAKVAPRRELAPAMAAPAGKEIRADTAPKGASPVIEKQPVTAKGARDQSEADYRRAMSLVTGARIAEATDVLLDVLRRDGGHTASRQLLARLLIEQRRLDEAYAILAEGLAMQPGQVGWAMTLARLQVERGDLAGAARTLQGSQSFAAGNADYLGFSGHVQQRLGQHKAAVEFYQSAVRLAPNEGRWWLGLGLALESDQRVAESREAFLRARSTGTLNADLQALVDQKLR